MIRQYANNQISNKLILRLLPKRLKAHLQEPPTPRLIFTNLLYIYIQARSEIFNTHKVKCDVHVAEIKKEVDVCTYMKTEIHREREYIESGILTFLDVTTNV